MHKPKNGEQKKPSSRGSNDLEAGFQKCAWWWRRLVFAEFVIPKEASGLRTAHEFETIRPSLKYLESVFRATRSSKFRVGIEQMNSLQFSDWKQGLERGAFHYELLRRHPDLEEFRTQPPWPEISAIECAWYAGALAKRPRPICKKQYPPDPDDNYSEPLDFQWDLTRSDNALSEKFLLLIHGERKRKGLIGDEFAEYIRSKNKLKLINLNTPNKGTSNKRKERPVSWRTVELLDLGSKRELNDTEDKAVKQTLQRLDDHWIKALRRAVKNATKDQTEHPPPNDFDHDRNPIWRWLQENLPIWEQSLPN